jgi:hypothetical protein
MKLETEHFPTPAEAPAERERAAWTASQARLRCPRCFPEDKLDNFITRYCEAHFAGHMGLLPKAPESNENRRLREWRSRRG